MSGWWFGTFLIVPYTGNFIIPTEKLIFFREVGGSTTNQPNVFTSNVPDMTMNTYESNFAPSWAFRQ